MKPLPKPQRRYDKIGPITCMAQVEGWLMVRRPGCIPFVVFWADWESMPTSPVKHAAAAEKP